MTRGRTDVQSTERTVAMRQAQAELLDQLIPPPWTRWRRSRAAAGLATAALVAMTLWWIGLLGPNLAPVTGYGFGATTDVPSGADGVVDVEFELHNRGLLDVEISQLWAAHLEGGHVVLDEVVVIPARDRAQLRFRFVVEDCGQLNASRRPLLSVAATSGAVTVNGKGLSVLGLDEQVAGWRDDSASWPSWWYLLAQSVCDPGARGA